MAMIGEIVLFAGSYAPRGWKVCNGQELDSWTYTALYGIMGQKYGGQIWSDNFALPNLPKVADSDGQGESMYIICVEGSYPAPP